jgi:UDP-N-acetylmuramyl tripeptide synthase
MKQQLTSVAEAEVEEASSFAFWQNQIAFCRFSVTPAGCVVQRHIYLKLLIMQYVLTACLPKAETIASIQWTGPCV